MLFLIFLCLVLWDDFLTYGEINDSINDSAPYTRFIQLIYERNTYVNAERTFHFLPWHVDRMRKSRENRLSETPIEFTALNPQLGQKNIIHLNDRPLQVYYRDDKNLEDLEKYNDQLCRAKVSKNSIGSSIDVEDAVLDIVFLCTGWCCGLDCCHINLTLIISIICFSFVAMSFAGYVTFRILCKKPQIQAYLRTLGQRQHKREIRRLPAQRRPVKKSGIRQARLAFGDEEQILQPSKLDKPVKFKQRPKARDPETARSFKVSKIKRFSRILEESEDLPGPSSSILLAPKVPLVHSISIPNLPAEFEYNL